MTLTAPAPTWAPTILTRDDTGLVPALTDRMARRPVWAIQGAVFHHAGVSYPRDHDPADIWRAIQRYHMGPHGSEAPHSDIDYNAGVWWDGTVLLGRDAGYRGAHAGAYNYNYTHTGIVLIGDGRNEDDVTDEAWRSMLWLWSLQALVVVNAGGPAAQGLVGHGETMPTACEGNYLHERLVSLRAFLAGLG